MTFSFDGEPVACEPGQTIAAALLADGRRVLRRSPSGAPRGMFCGIGACFDCLVAVNGRPGVRACLSEPAEGDEVRSG